MPDYTQPKRTDGTLYQVPATVDPYGNVIDSGYNDFLKSPPLLVLGPVDPVPVNTPIGTVILRTT